MVCISMNHASSSHHREGSKQGDLAVHQIESACTIFSRLYISQITNMPNLLPRTTMSLSVGVVVRTGSGASLEQVSKTVNMEPMQVVGSQPGEISSNVGL